MLYGGAGGGMDAEADMARKRRCARQPACCPARPFAAPANAFKLRTVRFPPPRTDCKPASGPARRLQARKRPSTPAFTAKTKSKFQAPKTPPSHGLTGLAAIKAGAKKRRERRKEAAGWRGACSDGRVFAAHCSVRLPCRCVPRCAAVLFVGLFRAWGGQRQQFIKRLCLSHDALIFQEQISGLENASVARFFGLGCYQSGSAISGCFQGAAAIGPFVMGLRACLVRERACKPGRQPFEVSKPAQARWRGGQRPVLLQEQEPVQEPENASVARFQGLCCY